MFEQLTDKISKTFRSLSGSAKIREENIREAVREIKLSLLEADVHYRVVQQFVSSVESKAVGSEVLESLTPAQQFVRIVRDELIAVLGGSDVAIDLNKKPPIVILMIGLQGSGKTTTSAKLARYLNDEKGRRPYLVSADVYRPAAIDQLRKLAEQNRIPFHPTSSKDDPIKVCQRAIDQARRNGEDVVIIDTAGRVTVDSDMMKELERIKAKVQPSEILLICDAMSGQDAVNVAKSFDEHLSISGVILTKMDGDARGGAALSIRFVVGRPIYFIGEGEKIDALHVFYPDRMVQRLLGMGDVLSLIEKVEGQVSESEALRMVERVQNSEFSLQDFLDQLRMMKRMGSMESVLGMIPGLGGAIKDIKFDDLERKLKKTEAMICSMTSLERTNVDILNGSRKRRIAKGSGTRPEDVNRLIKEYLNMKKLMKKFGGFGMRGLGKLIRGFRQRN